MSEPFIGEIRAFGFYYAPRNWAICGGQLLAISEYQALYSLLGTYYGGDGVTTFGLPDLRGRVAIGQGQSSGTSNYQIGARGGVEYVALDIDQMPSHSHSSSAQSTSAGAITVYADDATDKDPSGKYFGKPDTKIYVGEGRAKKHMATDSLTVTTDTQVTIDNAGENLFHENRQPFLAINYCIALFGAYPPRS